VDDPAPRRAVNRIPRLTSQAVVTYGQVPSCPRLLAQKIAGLRALKNETFSHCTSSCTKVFTLWPRTWLKENAMLEPKPRKQRPQNNQSGREPTFSAFSRPKSSWGRSRPLQQDATIALSRPKLEVVRTYPTGVPNHSSPCSQFLLGCLTSDRREHAGFCGASRKAGPRLACECKPGLRQIASDMFIELLSATFAPSGVFRSST
jgi:hypothetical protein